MAKEGGYRINNLYQGGYSTLDSTSYSPTGVYTGFQLASGKLGAPTKADTANQLAQVSSLLNQGIVPIEVSPVSPEAFEAIPKQHFKEINRMAKLTGAEISVHAPIIEASGMGEQGWDEASRKAAEHQLMSVVERVAPMNDKGNMPITIHGAGNLRGVEYIMTPEGKKQEKIYIVNRETGKTETILKTEKKFLLGSEKPEFSSPEEELNTLNNTSWSNTISQIMHHKTDADKLIRENSHYLTPEIMKDVKDNPGKLDFYPQQIRDAYRSLQMGNRFLSDANAAVNTAFNKAYMLGTEKEREILEEKNKKYTKEIREIEEGKRPLDINFNSKWIGEWMEVLSKDVKPKIYTHAEDFALEKSATTFGNVAFNAFEKYREKAPIISIENVFPGMAFSYGEELNKLVEESRKVFVKNAMEKGYSESKAKQEAERILGITLDVGHINIAKKHGFKDKDILDEIKAMGKNIRHVHLTDNFGYGDSHLPPGMGNVPFREILEELEKQGYSGRNIVESPAWPQHFGTSPLPYVLEAFGSPIYGGGPQWNQTTGLIQGYSGGFGEMLPQTHYQMFGAGFSQLPSNLGGSRGGGTEGSRMSGRGME